jgi:enamine deaminase RidA (YjgF/YER057c/UK114 family)
MPINRYEANAVYSKVVEANGFVYTAGIVPIDLSRDAKGQAEEVLAEIERLLKVAGTDKSKVVMTNLWLNDIRHREAVNEVWTKWTGGKNAPARATVEAKLIDPRMIIEVAVIAVK